MKSQDKSTHTLSSSFLISAQSNESKMSVPRVPRPSRRRCYAFSFEHLCHMTTVGLIPRWLTSLSLESSSAGFDWDGTRSIQETKPSCSSKEHTERMIKFMWSLLDMHFTRQDWTFWFSVKITTRFPLIKVPNSCSAVATARHSSSKMMVSWSSRLMSPIISGVTTSLKLPTHDPLESKATPPTPE